MKIVLLALDREAARAENTLRAAFPQATIETLPLAKVESCSASQRLRALRALKPEMLAVSTERLGWQQGQNALLLFGALGGANRILLFDAHGARRRETRRPAYWRFAGAMQAAQSRGSGDRSRF